MPATCFRCIDYKELDPGDPFGACIDCSAFACIKCGVRVPHINQFQCVMCYPSAVLLKASRIGGGLPGGGPDGGNEAPFTTTEEFEAVHPALADYSREERAYYHADLDRFVRLAREYGIEEAHREAIDERLQYRGYSDEQERARREDLRDGAQRLARDVSAAEAAHVLRRDLLADAFGVAQYAVGFPAGEEVPLERLWSLRDSRLRFIVGAAAAITGPLVH